jgi:hypothetical protein
MHPETGDFANILSLRRSCGGSYIFRQAVSRIDERNFLWYNTPNMHGREAFFMEEQKEKTPCNIALLAHV